MIQKGKKQIRMPTDKGAGLVRKTQSALLGPTKIGQREAP